MGRSHQRDFKLPRDGLIGVAANRAVGKKRGNDWVNVGGLSVTKFKVSGVHHVSLVAVSEPPGRLLDKPRITLVMLPLTESEITSALHDLPGWSVVDKMIAKTYIFKTYKDGLVFAVAVGNWADSLNHHPDIIIGYQKVTISLTTHDIGGIGPLDVDLAREIETLIPR